MQLENALELTKQTDHIVFGIISQRQGTPSDHYGVEVFRSWFHRYIKDQKLLIFS